MYQHLPWDKLPLQLLKHHSHPIPLIHTFLVKPHRPRLHQGEGQPLHELEHRDMIRKM